MVNESIGDAFIDAVMPSFFTSIYLLANALYKISLLAVLCPFCAVAAIFLYHTFVYRRAKKSHEERKILLQLRKRHGNFGREEARRLKTRHSREEAYGAGDFIRRLIVSLNDVIVTLITYLSDERLKRRVAVESAFVYKWRAMNKPALHQGTMHPNRVSDNISVIRLEENAIDNHYPVSKVKIVPYPLEIARMVKASHMWWTAHDSQSSSILDSLVHQTSIIFRSDYSLAIESRRELRATIIFDTEEALLLIFSKLSTAAVHEKGVDNDWKVELFEVPASALLEELQNIFDTFYPDGIPMSEVEKKEACELFREWIQGHDSSQSSGGVCSDSQMVRFKDFEDWFNDLSERIHDLTSDRLLTHILLLSHRSNAASADAVRLLNIVAPKRSNAVDMSSQSVRQSPVIASSQSTKSTENPFFGSPLLSPYSYKSPDRDSIQDIEHHGNGNDL